MTCLAPFSVTKVRYIGMRCFSSIQIVCTWQCPNCWQVRSGGGGLSLISEGLWIAVSFSILGIIQ